MSSPDELVNRGLIADMVANEPIINAKLAPADSGAGLPPTIPAGMRAISVQVNEVVGVAGFVTPGNHVDVVATISRQDNSMSRVVVSNVKVLAAGTKLDQQRAQTGEPIQTTVVTLLVTPSDGERIALASVEGRLHLTLRNPLDAEPTTTTGVRVAALLGSAEPPPRRKGGTDRRRRAPRRHRRRQSRSSRKSTRWKRSAPRNGPRRSSSDRS